MSCNCYNPWILKFMSHFPHLIFLYLIMQIDIHTSPQIRSSRHTIVAIRRARHDRRQLGGTRFVASGIRPEVFRRRAHGVRRRPNRHLCRRLFPFPVPRCPFPVLHRQALCRRPGPRIPHAQLPRRPRQVADRGPDGVSRRVEPARVLRECRDERGGFVGV